MAKIGTRTKMVAIYAKLIPMATVVPIAQMDLSEANIRLPKPATVVKVVRRIALPVDRRTSGKLPFFSNRYL